MNTPLLQSLATAARSIEGLRMERYYNDARNYKGPRDVPAGEAAQMIAAACQSFLLDWSRIEDGRLPIGEAIMIAAREPEVPGEGVVVGEGSLERIGGATRFFYASGCEASGVFAWAPLPVAPRPEQLIGFAPRNS